MTSINEILKDYEECTFEEWESLRDGARIVFDNVKNFTYFKKKKPEIKFPVRVELGEGEFKIWDRGDNDFRFMVSRGIFLNGFVLEDLDKINKAVAEIREQKTGE